MSNDLLLKIDSKLDKIQEDIVEIKIAQAKQEANLEANTKTLVEHMHRSNLLEESQEILYEEVTKIKIHSAQVDGIFKFLGILSTIVSVAVGLLKLFHKI
jgi:hypothetical protein